MVSGGTVTAEGAYCGINAGDKIEISGGTATATGGFGINGSSSMDITGGTVTATGNVYNGIYSNAAMKIGNGIVAPVEAALAERHLGIEIEVRDTENRVVYVAEEGIAQHLGAEIRHSESACHHILSVAERHCYQAIGRL